MIELENYVVLEERSRYFKDMIMSMSMVAKYNNENLFFQEKHFKGKQLSYEDTLELLEYICRLLESFGP
jgi:hypothetical protein